MTTKKTYKTPQELINLIFMSMNGQLMPYMEDKNYYEQITRILSNEYVAVVNLFRFFLLGSYTRKQLDSPVADNMYNMLVVAERRISGMSKLSSVRFSHYYIEIMRDILREILLAYVRLVGANMIIFNVPQKSTCHYLSKPKNYMTISIDSVIMRDTLEQFGAVEFVLQLSPKCYLVWFADAAVARDCAGRLNGCFSGGTILDVKFIENIVFPSIPDNEVKRALKGKKYDDQLLKRLSGKKPSKLNVNAEEFIPSSSATPSTSVTPSTSEIKTSNTYEVLTPDEPEMKTPESSPEMSPEKKRRKKKKPSNLVVPPPEDKFHLNPIVDKLIYFGVMSYIYIDWFLWSVIYGVARFVKAFSHAYKNMLQTPA